jgi:hypothetical protein
MVLPKWIRRHVVSPDVREALEGSKERAAHAEEFRAEIEQRSAPLQEVLRKNGFEKAVLATFQRRHA